MRRSATTVVSTKGQIILPKAMREQRRWLPGTRLIVEESADGLFLRAAAQFPAMASEDVFGSLATDGKAKTLEEMERGIAAEAKRKHAGD